MAAAEQRCIVYELPDEAYFALSCSRSVGSSWSPNGHSERVPVTSTSSALGDAIVRALGRRDPIPLPASLRATALVRMLGRRARTSSGVERRVVVSRIDDVVTIDCPSGHQAMPGETMEQLGDRIRAALAEFG